MKSFWYLLFFICLIACRGSSESIKGNCYFGKIDSIHTFSQERKILYEQIALNYFMDSVWTKDIMGNDDRVFIIPQVNSKITYLRAPFKFTSGKGLLDSTEIDFYYFEIDEAQMYVTRWYNAFLVF